jgi:hypothetical protein
MSKEKDSSGFRAKSVLSDDLVRVLRSWEREELLSCRVEAFRRYAAHCCGGMQLSEEGVSRVLECREDSGEWEPELE